MGIDGNEKADELAKEGIQGPEREVRLTRAHLKQLLRDQMETEWNKAWTNDPGYKHTKFWFPDVWAPQRGKLHLSCHRPILGKAVQF